MCLSDNERKSEVSLFKNEKSNLKYTVCPWKSKSKNGNNDDE